MQVQKGQEIKAAENIVETVSIGSKQQSKSK